ncbi:hypothetical protein [Novosphingobium sp. AP12]|uniref:hypothetical protein n=1 Tax=Novosphingobium sp. AP12 TaxID=1144305 RepID=UPI0012FC9A40|nr:hypothetical protein [Novosphingobium sp. AP12]
MDVKIKYLGPDPKTGVLRYRRPFPAPLVPFAGDHGESLTELKVSLGARSISEAGAMERFQAAARRFEAMAARAKKRREKRFDCLGAPEIAFLSETYRSQQLAQDAHRRLDPVSKARAEWLTERMAATGLEVPPHRPTARWTVAVKEATEVALRCYRDFAADGDVDGILSAWRGPALDLTSSCGYLVDETADDFRVLCIRLNETAIEVHEAELQRWEGRVVPTPASPTPVMSPERRKAPAVAERTFAAITMELIEKPRWKFNEPTKERVRGALRFLKEAVGDLTPSELTREKVTSFLDLLAQRPSKLPKADFHMTLPNLAKRYAGREDVRRITEKTQEAYILALNARWNNAQSEGTIPKALTSPFSDRQFRRGTSGNTEKGYSPDELKAYFAMPVFIEGVRPKGGKGEAVYWLPLIAMFTGARPEEVAQLLVSDIHQHEWDSRWVIKFTDEGLHPVKGQQSLKTEGQESGRRAFPLPQPLLDLGLLDYLAFLKGEGELALFPLLRRKGKRRGIYASFGEWMCDYVYDQGVFRRGSGRQPVRGFRHTWSTAARSSGIYREAMEYIQGHKAQGGGSANEGYGDRDGLGDQVDRLQFKVNVLDLVPRWRRPA